ncbi:MAG TPA: hypothetical protein VFL82_13645 [Thermomicrobiales bacterium]|nr:hypothetical protein [Thermomicrobiales bacterium]
MKLRHHRQAADSTTSRIVIVIALVLTVTLALIALPAGSPRVAAGDGDSGATPVSGEPPVVITPISTAPLDPAIDPVDPTESPTQPAVNIATATANALSASMIDATVYPTRPSNEATPPPTKPPQKRRAGFVTIDPNRKTSADPGTSVTQRHAVTNRGTYPDLVNLTVSSSRHWIVAIYTASGSSLLADHDGDGRPDTGTLAPGERRVVSIVIQIPPDARAATTDVTAITARSSIDPNGKRGHDSVKDTTKVTQVFSLIVSTDTVDFGEVTADGRVDPAAPGIISTVDDQGAYYVMPQAIRVTIISNTPWTGNCRATENVGGSPTVRVGSGRLEWRLSGTDRWIPFTTRKSNACFPAPPITGGTYTYDIRLRVENTDQPGAFRSVVTFSATP